MKYSREIRILKGEPDLLLTIPMALPVLFLIVIFRRFIHIRIGFLHCDRLGHFAGNTEQYLCERNYQGQYENRKNTLDLFYLPRKKSCNETLESMWRGKLNILPRLILRPLCLLIRSFDSLEEYRCGNTSNQERDVLNLLDRYPPSLEFTSEQEKEGQIGLSSMGIPLGAPFVCLMVRDSAYLSQLYGEEATYHNYRDADIQNFVLVAEELANRGYFVIRMGAQVREALKTSHQRVIDYATNGMRSDFMDIYLGAKCKFCVSTSTGWDSVPQIFRRPIVYTNFVPLGCMNTSRAEVLTITKRHVFQDSQKSLTLREIFTHGVGFGARGSVYESEGIQLIENTPEEICDVVVEMVERLKGTWQPREDDEVLQRRFWEIFPTDAKTEDGRPFHGEIRARYGAAFLRNNRWWLE